MNNEHLGDRYTDRKAVYDVYCQLADGSKMIVEMQKAEQAEIAHFSPEEQREYVASKKDYWDNYSIVTTAHDKGLAEGLEKGEHIKALDTARRMKSDGMSDGVQK